MASPTVYANQEPESTHATANAALRSLLSVCYRYAVGSGAVPGMPGKEGEDMAAGPGKFEAIADDGLRVMAEGLYSEVPDDEASLGGEGYVDWYGLFALEPSGAVIIHEDDQGFVTARAYHDLADAEAEMDRLHEIEGECLS